MRYVKMGHHEPGVRRDLATGEDVYSSRFLNAEEHGTDWKVFDVWCSVYCFVANMPAWFQKHLSVRFDEMNFAEQVFTCLGVVMLFFILWASLGFWLS